MYVNAVCVNAVYVNTVCVNAVCVNAVCVNVVYVHAVCVSSCRLAYYVSLFTVKLFITCSEFLVTMIFIASSGLL